MWMKIKSFNISKVNLYTKISKICCLFICEIMFMSSCSIKLRKWNRLVNFHKSKRCFRLEFSRWFKLIYISYKNKQNEGFLVLHPFSMGYKLKSKNNYDIHEDNFIKSVSWLNDHNLNQPQRKLVNKFVFRWIMGSLKIYILLSGYLIDIYDANPYFLMVFLGNWAKYFIERMRTRLHFLIMI